MVTEGRAVASRPVARRHEDGDEVEAINILVAAKSAREAERVRGALRHISNRLEVFTDPERTADRLLRRGEFRDERRAPDLAILDAQMLGPRCYDLIRDYRKSELKHTVIAVMDDSPDMDRVEDAREAGASAYVRKPLNLESMADLIEDVPGVGFAIVRNNRLQLAPR